MTREEAIEAIKFGHCDDMYYRKEYEEAVDMAVKALEQKQKEDEIRVGDEVYIINENNKSVVTHIFNASHGPAAMLLSGDAEWIDVDLPYLTKTGKHYSQIEEVLKELRGDENNADSN